MAVREAVDVRVRVRLGVLEREPDLVAVPESVVVEVAVTEGGGGLGVPVAVPVSDRVGEPVDVALPVPERVDGFDAVSEGVCVLLDVALRVPVCV